MMLPQRPTHRWACLVMMVLPTLLMSLCLVTADVGADESPTILQVDLPSWERTAKQGGKLLVLLYKNEGCKRCPDALDMLELLNGQPEIPSDVNVGRSADASLHARLGVATLPALVFLREKSFVIYDGKLSEEPVLSWVPAAYQAVLSHLGDKSFEHLTQASTGATTGDWLVAFYTSQCQDVLQMLETVGVKFRGTVNVAGVDTSTNPQLKERFSVKACPTVIYFKQGKMYRYDVPTLDVAPLKSFLSGFYRNSKAERVPVPKSQFDYLTENIADFLKNQLEGKNGVFYIAGAAITMIVFFVLGVVLGSRGREKTD